MPLRAPGRGRYPGQSVVSLKEIRILRERLLVAHAKGKCADCGATLVADPIPHRCDPMAGVKSIDPGRYLL